MTRSVEDAAVLFNLLQGPDPRDPQTLRRPPDDPLPGLKRGVAGLRLGVLPQASATLSTAKCWRPTTPRSRRWAGSRPHRRGRAAAALQ